MIGETISHYRVLEKIGEGGMGEVYLAEDTTLDRKVAVKFLPGYLENDEIAQTRFLREAKSAAAIDHPYICKIHEVGEVENRHFIVMEYVEGDTLKERLAEGPLPRKEAIKIASEVAEAIEEAHSKKIVHRDLKPANIMLTKGNHPKVMDFGLAKRVSRDDKTEMDITKDLTREGTTLGTLTYMSPEQLRGQPVDTRADLFSFGIVLYEMLTGVHPFRKNTQAETVNAIFNESPPGIATYSEDTSDILQHTVQKLLAKDPNRRYQSIHEVITNLDQLIEDTGRTGLWPVVKAKFYLNSRWVVAAALCVAVAAIALVVWSLPEPGPVKPKHGFILADFDTGNPDFDQVLDDTVRTAVSQTTVQVFADRSLLEHMVLPPDTRVTPELAREMCPRWGKWVQSYMYGTLIQLGEKYQLTLNARLCHYNWSHVEQRQVNSEDEVIDALAEASIVMAELLEEVLPKYEPVPAPAVWARTRSLEAARLHQKGFDNLRAGKLREAIAFYQKSTEYDPGFASSHMVLSHRYSGRGQLKLARSSALRAWESRDREEGSHEQGAIDIAYYRRVQFDIDEAIKVGLVTVERYPGHIYRWEDLAYSYTAAGQLEEALKAKLEGLQIRNSKKRFGNPFGVGSQYIELGRLDEAKADLDRQLSEGRKGTGLYRQLWRIAFLEDDREAMQKHARQIEAEPGEDGMFFLRLQEAFYRGRYKKGRELLDDFVLLVRQQERSEFAERLLCEQAWVEGVVGNENIASGYLDTPVEVESIHLDQAIGNAYALALMGKSDQVERILSSAIELYPEATLLNNLHAPTMRAMIEHLGGDSESARRRFRTIARYEQAPQADKFKLIRGLILLDLNRGDDAIAALQKILDYPGQIVEIDYAQGIGYSWIEIPVAQVGLARAKAMTGDIDGARKAYEEFFDLWKDADSDIPLLQEAKAEYANL